MSALNKKLALLISAMVLMLNLNAQPQLAVDSAWTLPQDTVVWNGLTYNLAINVVVENTGNALMNGSFDIVMQFLGDTSATQYVMGNFDPQGLEVGEKIQVSVIDSITTIAQSNHRYKGGDNVLVIWPRAEAVAVMVPDTAFVDLYIFDIRNSTADQVQSMRERLSVYPSPAQDYLNLDYRKEQHKLEHVRLRSIDGRLLYESKSLVHAIPLLGLPAGTLMLEVKYRDGIQGTYKIVHIGQ